MTTKGKKHFDDNCFYHNATNEDGWFCSCCGELGFRPDLDRKLLYIKISGILQDLNQHKFVYVSNASQGEFIVRNVFEECKNKRRYDQYFILREILNEPNIDVKGHSSFWNKESINKLKEKKQ
jgi:hypothetical protein